MIYPPLFPNFANPISIDAQFTQIALLVLTWLMALFKIHEPQQTKLTDFLPLCHLLDFIRQVGQAVAINEGTQ